MKSSKFTRKTGPPVTATVREAKDGSGPSPPSFSLLLSFLLESQSQVLRPVLPSTRQRPFSWVPGCSLCRDAVLGFSRPREPEPRGKLRPPRPVRRLTPICDNQVTDKEQRLRLQVALQSRPRAQGPAGLGRFNQESKGDHSLLCKWDTGRNKGDFLGAVQTELPLLRAQRSKFLFRGMCRTVK